MTLARSLNPRLAFAAIWLAIAAVGSTSPAAETYEFDFRGGQFGDPALVSIGYDSPYSMQLIRPERKGLHLTIPGSQGRTRPKLGLFAALKLEGDFEITTDFELVKAETPDVGAGVGANLYLMAEGSLNGATLRRCAAPDGQDAFFVHWALRQADGGRTPEVLYAPAQKREGKLRLTRSGTKLDYLVAEGDDLEFRELKSVDFGPDPIALIQLQAVTDGAAKNVEMYWRSVSIRADKLTRVDIPLLRRPPLK